MSCNRNNSVELKLAGIELALQETRLFLDTHIGDAQAMAYYQKKLAARGPALEEYLTSVGPLTMYDFNDTQDNWATGCWPWQVEE